VKSGNGFVSVAYESGRDSPIAKTLAGCGGLKNPKIRYYESNFLILGVDGQVHRFAI